MFKFQAVSEKLATTSEFLYLTHVVQWMQQYYTNSWVTRGLCKKDSPFGLNQSNYLNDKFMVKVKFSHTRYRVLGFELILVYRQSDHRWLFKPSPGGRLPLLTAGPAVTFSAKELHRPSTSIKLYCSVTEAHRCEQLAQGCYADGHGETWTHDLNDRKSNALPLSHLHHPFMDQTQIQIN